jgi:hypothetical protein
VLFRSDHKKQNTFKSPDINKLQVVIIDKRTKIYIPRSADPEEARRRYLSRSEVKVKTHVASRKQVAP